MRAEILLYNKLPGEARLRVPGLRVECRGSRLVGLTPERLSSGGLVKVSSVSDSAGPGRACECAFLTHSQHVIPILGIAL